MRNIWEGSHSEMISVDPLTNFYYVLKMIMGFSQIAILFKLKYSSLIVLIYFML